MDIGLKLGLTNAIVTLIFLITYICHLFAFHKNDKKGGLKH